MPVSKLWRVGGLIVLVVLGAILLLCVWGIFFTGSSGNSTCESALGVAGLGSTVFVETVDSETNFRYYQSNDNGYTWKTSRTVPEDVQYELYRSSPKSTLACNPAETKTCYRILSRQQDEFTDLEQSSDGGQSWQQVPIPSRLFTERFCYNMLSTPRSLTFVKTNGANESYILVVAVDTNGVLMLTPEGTWTQHTINKLHGRE